MIFFKQKPKSATEAIKLHLIKYGKIDQLECLKITGSWRLSSAIHELRKQGMNILSAQKQVTTRYGQKTYVSIYSI